MMPIFFGFRTLKYLMTNSHIIMMDPQVSFNSRENVSKYLHFLILKIYRQWIIVYFFVSVRPLQNTEVIRIIVLTIVLQVYFPWE